MSKISKTDFIAGLKKSRLVDSKRLAELLENSKDDSPQEIAKKLIREELATKWQAKYLLSGRTRLDIGSYRLLERIQRNEFGDRFLAVHTSLARKVDLQVLPGSLTQEKANCDEFMQKASIAAKLDHPNLAHVYDIDQEGGRYFLVTEHVDGKVLSEADQSSLTESQIAGIVRQAVEGIQYAHKNDVVHGCIGQSDLILSHDEDVKIQHLPLSPLRQQKLDAIENPTPNQDFAAIARIGNELLSSSKSVSADRTLELKAAFASLSIGSDETIETATQVLTKMIEAKASDAAPFDGGFDQPIPSSAPLRKKKTAEPEPEEKPEVVTPEPGYLARLWRDNPVAVIATSTVMVLMLIGGSVFAGIQLAGQRNQPEPSNTIVKKDREGQTEKKTNNAAKDNSKLNTKPNRKNAPEIPTKEQMSAVLADMPEGNPKGFRKNNKKNNKPNPKSEVAAAENKSANNARPATKQNQNANPIANDGAANPQRTNASAETDPAENQAMAANNPIVSDPTEIPAEVHEDLKIIRGIAEKTENVLQVGGVTSLEQMAAMSPEEIRAAIIRGGWSTANRIDDYKSWIIQAKKIIGDETPMSTDTVSAETPGPINSTPPPNVTGAFAKFPRIVSLPEPEDTTEISLGNVALVRPHVLGASIVCEEGFAKGRTVFELERANDSSLENDEQLWNVGLKKSENHDPIVVATLRRKAEQVFFKWLPEASTDKNAKKLAGYLQNCFLKLFSGDDTTFVTLREPVTFHDLRMTQDSPTNEVEFSVPWMPAPETIVVEVLPMRVPDTETRVQISGIERNIPGIIWLKNDDKTGFLRIRVRGEMRSKIKLYSDLILILSNGQIQTVNSFASLDDLKVELDRAAYQAQVAHNQFTKTANMKKTDFDAQKKELSKVANAKQRIKDQIKNYSEILPKLLDQPISVRVYSKLGKMQTILAVSDPEVPQESKK